MIDKFFETNPGGIIRYTRYASYYKDKGIDIMIEIPKKLNIIDNLKYGDNNINNINCLYKNIYNMLDSKKKEIKSIIESREHNKIK